MKKFKISAVAKPKIVTAPAEDEEEEKPHKNKVVAQPIDLNDEPEEQAKPFEVEQNPQTGGLVFLGPTKSLGSRSTVMEDMLAAAQAKKEAEVSHPRTEGALVFMSAKYKEALAKAGISKEEIFKVDLEADSGEDPFPEPKIEIKTENVDLRETLEKKIKDAQERYRVIKCLKSS